MEQSSNTYIGFTEQRSKIWQIEFELDTPPVNSNCHFKVKKFKIISIEDFDGKSYRKDTNFAVGSNYYLRKHPVLTFLNKTNLMYYDFYNKRRHIYECYTGQITEYHENGDIYFQYFLNNGILEGNFVVYDKCNNQIESAYFINGKRHGKSICARYYHLLNISENNKMYTIECEFNMGINTSWNINFETDEAHEIININKYDVVYDKDKNCPVEIDMAKYDRITGKYYCKNDDYDIEWTENNNNIDTYIIKCSDKCFKKNYLINFSDIPKTIQNKKW
jgi:hypothetical protein